jgi:4-hydroxy-2-oxoheptanedioate aldolase
MLIQSYLNLKKNISSLKKKFGLVGIKAEFEAEGSTNSDISRLKILSSELNTQLHVKIGGVEAKNDIHNCIELGVDGIIAPMVETEFGLIKFIDTVKNLKLNKKPFLSINLETITAYNNFEKIISRCMGNIHNITIGRSDLSSSIMNEKIDQNSEEITEIILSVGKRLKNKNIKLTVGGGINKRSIEIFKKKKIWSVVDKLETRKIILDTKSMLKNGALNECINFETNYIINKKDIYNLKIRDEIKRLQNLKSRKK